MDWTLFSLIAGLISAICWLIGDIFLVGFDLEKAKYQDFLKSTNIKNKTTTILMLSGSVPRLRFGALIANFSIPLMVASAFALYELADTSVWSSTAAAMLAIGFCISSVAHVAFYYVGTLCKALYEDYRQGAPVSKSSGKLVNEYMYFMDITWRAAVGITFAGWILYTVLILLGKTAFPPQLGLLTPLIISPLAGLSSAKLKVGRPYLNGAGLNVGLTVFFLAALIWYLQQ